jgi:hypothetical protein
LYLLLVDLRMKKIILFLLLILILPLLVYSQKKDSLAKPSKDSIARPYHYNVIRFNPTPMLLWGNLRNITFSYERLIKPNQSLVLQLGYLEFLPVFRDSIGGVVDVRRKTNFGLNAAFDYRFYPLKRNRFPAPDGLYIGGYVSYYGFKFTDDITLYNTDTLRTGSFTTGFNYINLGFELGYQFILWKRLAIDLLIFGPSLTCTITTVNLDDLFNPEERSEIIQDFKEGIKEKYPYLAPSVDFSEDKTSISFRTFFRYSISIGYHF